MGVIPHNLSRGWYVKRLLLEVGEAMFGVDSETLVLYTKAARSRFLRLLSGLWSHARNVASDDPDPSGAASWLRNTFPLVYNTFRLGLFLCLLLLLRVPILWATAPVQPASPCDSYLLSVVTTLPCPGFYRQGHGFCFLQTTDDTTLIKEYIHSRVLYSLPPYGDLPSHGKRPRDVALLHQGENGKRMTSRLNNLEAMCASYVHEKAEIEKEL